MSRSFDASETTVPGRVLAILRTVSGWSQKQLAAASGLHHDQISNYERGRTEPPLSKLQVLLEVMGLPPQLLEAAIAFLSEADAAVARFRGGEDDVLGSIDAIAAGVGRSWQQFARSNLIELISEARNLEARRQAPVLWARLRPYSAVERRAIVREVAEFQSWALCVLVCEESVAAAADDAAVAVVLGELAVEIALLARGDERWLKRLEGYARAFHANAIRVSGNLGAADEAFARALEVWASGAPADPGPLDATRLLELEASLRHDQRRLDESLELLDRAIAAHPTGAAGGRLLLKRAKTLEELNDYESAVATLRQAAPLIDPASDPRLSWILRFNLAFDLCHLGRAAAAAPLVPEIRALAEGIGNRLDLLRCRSLEGYVAAGLGSTAEAIAAFREVLAGFVASSMPFDAALATMQLALVYLVQGGRTAEVKALAAQAAPIFEHEGVHLEARKALALFCRAAQEERLTLELVRRLAIYLERARSAPALAFEAIA